MKKILIALLLSLLCYSTPCFAQAADMMVTVAGAGDNSGDTWANAMALSDWETDCEASAEAGDRYFVAGGTYTLTGNFFCANDGTVASPISIIGVATGTTNEPPVFSDWADGAARPLIAAAGNDFTVDNAWVVRNLRLTTTDSTGFDTGNLSVIENNASFNSSGTANRNAFTPSAGTGSVYINNDMSSTSGDCVDWDFTDEIRLFYNYCHDGNKGFEITNSDRNTFIGNIFDTITTTAIDLQDAENGNSIVGNTIYNVATGLDIEAAGVNIIYNNIFNTCSTVGITQDSNIGSTIFDYNNYSNNFADVTNVTQGANATTADPQFTDAGGGDFSLGTNLKALGFPGEFQAGLTTGFKEPGAVQREEAGGAAAATTAYGFTK